MKHYIKLILHLDLLSDYPDRKSILMYVMCLFQQLPSSNIIIEDKGTNETSTMTTIITNNDNMTEMKVRLIGRKKKIIIAFLFQ